MSYSDVENGSVLGADREIADLPDLVKPLAQVSVSVEPMDTKGFTSNNDVSDYIEDLFESSTRIDSAHLEAEVNAAKTVSVFPRSAFIKPAPSVRRKKNKKKTVTFGDDVAVKNKELIGTIQRILAENHHLHNQKQHLANRVRELESVVESIAASGSTDPVIFDIIFANSSKSRKRRRPTT